MWDIIYLQTLDIYCLFSSVMYWRLLHNWNTFKKVYLQFLLYLQSFIKEKGLNFENGYKSIPSRAGIFKKNLYVPYWVSIPNYLIFFKKILFGKMHFFVHLFGHSLFSLYNFWQFCNFVLIIPTLHCMKCHQIFTVCKKENILGKAIWRDSPVK